MNLDSYKEIIRNLNPIEQCIYFDHNHWINFKYNNPVITTEVSYISKNYQNGISRKDIISYLSKENSSIRIGFLLTMIWGHGYSEHGKADNRGPWKVSKMLHNIEDSNLILEGAKYHLKQNDLESAYTCFDNMDRCRVNFFSKFLYFLGRSLNMNYYPLIFDTRVAKTMGRLTLDSDLFSILEIQPKQSSAAYCSYIKKIHSIADTLELEAENIEYFLFNGTI